MRITLLYLLDWAIIAVSFFNTIALLWLGLAVLLNAERRGWGTWTAGGGLLLGGLFFAGHSSVVGRVFDTLSTEIAFWWRLGWLPAILGPYLWCLVIGWYTGVLTTSRQRRWLVVASALGAGALGAGALALLLFTNALPGYAEIRQHAPATLATLGRIFALVLVYPLYCLLCIVLALFALRHPEASHRLMGDLARRRAQPWLVAASLALLGVSFAVAAAAIWFLSHIRSETVPALSLRALPRLMIFDLLIGVLLAITIVLMGRAIVSYELFTGKALPRGDLFLQWRRSLVLAACYSAVMGLLLGYFNDQVDSIYRLLLATVMMTVFFALAGWRSYAERERGMERLRPFIASQQLYERLLGPQNTTESEAALPFRALCADVLGARVGYLAALGARAALAGPVLAYPPGATPPAVSLFNDLIARPPDLPDQSFINTKIVVAAGMTALTAGRSARAAGRTTRTAGRDALAAGRDALTAARVRLNGSFLSPQTLCVAVDATRYEGAVWAVPLWGERGLVGALLLGEKRDGGLYTQEEVEIARAAGERLIDTQASSALAQRLMALQRQRLAESQVLDRRTRRALHDDVLPLLHAALLTLGVRGQGSGVRGQETHAYSTTADSDIEAVVGLLTEAHQQIAHLLRELPATALPEVTRHGLVGALQHTIASELQQDFDEVTWQLAPEAMRATEALAPLKAEVLFCAAREALRNAARYGRGGDPARALHLSVVAQCADGLQLTIADNGVGMGAAQVAAGGSGHGLALHSTMMAVIGGALTVESAPGAYTRVVLSLPAAALQAST